MTNVALNNVESVCVLPDKFVNNDLVDVNVYKEEGSFVGHFDIYFLINLLEQVSNDKGYVLNIDNLSRLLKGNSIQYKEICMTLATELAYKFSLFVKYLTEKGISDFDWFCSFKGDDSKLVIYGINNVVSELCRAISLYCERVEMEDLKQYFLEQLEMARLSSRVR